MDALLRIWRHFQLRVTYKSNDLYLVFWKTSYRLKELPTLNKGLFTNQLYISSKIPVISIYSFLSFPKTKTLDTVIALTREFIRSRVVYQLFGSRLLHHGMVTFTRRDYWITTCVRQSSILYFYQFIINTPQFPWQRWIAYFQYQSLYSKAIKTMSTHVILHNSIQHFTQDIEVEKPVSKGGQFLLK